MEAKSSTQSNKELGQELERKVPLAKLMEGVVIRTMQKDMAVLEGRPLPPSPEKTEVKEKAPPPTKLPVAGAVPKLVPFKEKLKKWLEKVTARENRLKAILAGLAILVLIGGTGGFFYWWAYLRVVPPPPIVTHYECQDFQCLSVEGEGENQCQTDEDCQPVEPTVPEPLIPVDETQTIELSFGDEKQLSSELAVAAEEEQASSTFRHILVKLVGQREKEYMDLETFFFALEVAVPENVLEAVPTTTPGAEGENYTLFFFGQSEGNRLGIVTTIEEDSLDLMLKLWEGRMETDLRPLHLGLKDEPAATEEFLDNVYRDANIRYINFPGPDLSIDYAVVDDKLIIATSRASMYAVIDALLLAEEIDTSDWQTYQNEEYGFEFKYPKKWFVYEREGERRVYIQTVEGEVSKGAMPTDFKRVWIAYTFDESKERPENSLVDYSGVTKYTATNNEILMDIYEYKDIDTGEKTTEAYWSRGNDKYMADCASEVGQRHSEDEVVILKQILSTFKFVEFADAETVRAQIASDLREGDIESALRGFQANEKSATISAFDTAQLNQLADWIEKASLTEEGDSSRIYRYSWTDESGENFVEFTMAKNEIGQWIITSW